MDAIIRATTIYILLLVVFRISGKRTLAEVTPFDFILLLIIGESAQQALLGDDFSIVNAVIVFTTLLTIDIIFSYIKQKSQTVSKWLEGTPLVIVKNGKAIEKRMRSERVDIGDVLESARKHHGIERMEQIKYAVLEKSGGITIIPK